MAEKKIDWRTALEAAVDERRRDLGPHPEPGEIVAYHAGELAAEDAERLQDHLVVCPECARLLLDLDAFAAEASAAASGRSAPVISIRGYRARRRGWLAAAAAVAASLFIVVGQYGEPLTDYEPPRIFGNVESDRGTETPLEEALVFETGGRLDLKLQPKTTVDAPVTARAYLRHDGELRALSTATLEVRGNGVVSLEGIVGADLLLPVGDSELVMAVARPGALPSRRRLRDELDTQGASRGRKWIGFKRKIRVEEPADRPPDAGAPAVDGEGPWIEYAGCRTVLIGPICVLRPDRRLTLWVRHHRDDEVRIEAGGWRRSYSPTEVQDGYRYEVEVGRWTSELAVEVVQGEKRLVWTLEVREDPVPDWLTKAQELYGSGEWDEARRLLEPRISGPDPTERGSALSLLARLERRSGNAELGDGYYRRALAAHREAGRLHGEPIDAAGWVFYLIQERRFPEARALLESLPVDAAGGSARLRYSAAYYRGLLAERTGDLRVAMARMDRAVRAAERAGLSRRQILFANDILARLLHTVGLTDEAAALDSLVWSEMEDLCSGESAAVDACDCARLLNNRAWNRLLALEAGGPADDPSTLLEDAERILVAKDRGDASCLLPEDLLNSRLNLALTALHAGETAEASRHLVELEIEPEKLPRLALSYLDLEARISLAEGSPTQALAVYEELARLAERSSSPKAAWRSAFGRARALASLERTEEALEACAVAEGLLNEESLLVPMHRGRERFIAQREQAARFCLDLGLRTGREAEALAVARRSAARALRHLRVGAKIAALGEEERRRWEQTVSAYNAAYDEIERSEARIWEGLPGDEAKLFTEKIERQRQTLRGLLDQFALLAGGPAPPDLAVFPRGTLLLAYHPLPQGWAAIANDERGVTARLIEELPLEADDETLSALLLEPFAERIAGAKEVRVIPYGALRDVDFHALPFAGDVLLRQAPVVYHVDLPEASAGVSPPAQRALIVSAPGLRETPAEGWEVRRILESWSEAWRVELVEGEEASGYEVRKQLPEVDLFHYAGHAEFDDSRGWDSHLSLADGSRLTVDDILVSHRVPRWVVLSGCKTGRDSRTSPLPSIGLAQAFLVAGTEAVVAATADVDDADAAALAEALYRHWDESTPLVVALQEAQLELRDEAPDSDWRKFRILTR